MRWVAPSIYKPAIQASSRFKDAIVHKFKGEDGAGKAEGPDARSTF